MDSGTINKLLSYMQVLYEERANQYDFCKNALEMIESEKNVTESSVEIMRGMYEKAKDYYLIASDAYHDFLSIVEEIEAENNQRKKGTIYDV